MWVPWESRKGTQQRVEKTAILWMGHINLLLCQSFRGGFSLVCNKNKEKVRWNMFWLLLIVKEWENAYVLPGSGMDHWNYFPWKWVEGRKQMPSGWDHRTPQNVWGSFSLLCMVGVPLLSLLHVTYLLLLWVKCSVCCLLKYGLNKRSWDQF